MLEPKFSSVLSTAVPVSCFDPGPITEMWRVSPSQRVATWVFYPPVLSSVKHRVLSEPLICFKVEKPSFTIYILRKKSFYFIIFVFFSRQLARKSLKMRFAALRTYFPANWMSVLKWSFVFSLTCGGRLPVTLNRQGQGSVKHQWALGMQERPCKLGWRRGSRRA